MAKHKASTDSDAEETSNNSFGAVIPGMVSVPNLGSVLFGALMAVLLLSSGTINRAFAATSFAAALGVILLAIIWMRWQSRKQIDRKSTWGLGSLFALGFALGTLIYQYREWIKWLWAQYRRINEPWELIMEGLFLFGVILGFFVVRNWSKDQKDFMASLTAVLGGAVISTVLGPLTKSVDSIESFAYYFLGFALSGALNLIGASWLMANYSNKPSVTNRALLDFLYGSDKAEAIDRQFLKNFEKDPVYARRLMTESLDDYKGKVLREFAHKLDLKRKEQKSVLTYFILSSIEGPLKDSSARHEEAINILEFKGAKAAANEKPFTVNIRKLRDHERIAPEMFRMSISVKYQEYLEYIGRDTGGWKPFPLLGSVAGLALLAGQTIVMDRDKFKRFRTREHLEGISPADVEQQRGLDEIAYLSYISIPVMTELGNYRETPLGIISVSSKLFAMPSDLELPDVDKDGNCRVRVLLSSLTNMAKLIYEHNDECVSFLEDMRTVTVPLLELYLRCRQGAT